MFAPIVLFVYNRPDHTQRTVEALQKNFLAKDSELYIYSDAAKSEKDEPGVFATRNYLRTIAGFKEITIREKKDHAGLANSLISGISEVISAKEKAIVLEDDLVSSPNMLSFLNDSLEFYQTNPKIFSISAYTFPIHIPEGYTEDVFLSYRALSWGWATWKDRWEKADWQIKDFDDFIHDLGAQAKFNRGGEDLTRMLTRQMKGEIDSWAVRWAYNQYKNNAFSILPVKSKIINIGADRSGTHVGKTSKFNVILDDMSKPYKLSGNLSVNPELTENLKKIFRKKPLFIRLVNALYDQF